MDDLNVAWMLVGWMLSFWAGKDLQARVAHWRQARQESPEPR